MKQWNKIMSITMFFIKIQIVCSGHNWRKTRCSMDRHPIKAGLLPPEEIGRFPWMGVIQHDFYSADKMRYSVTGAVLIHPEYALAAAEEMAKIDRDIIRNSTNFMVWYSAVVKYTIGVADYMLHMEYEGLTYATTALVRLVRDGAIELGDPGKAGYKGPVMQICLPVMGSGSGTFGNIYAVKVTDEYGDFQKEVVGMDIVDVKNCDLYDDKAEPDMKMLVPTYPICANAQGVQVTCFVESGAVLVSRESEVYWTLLGFGVRGPSCAAPARFIYLMSQMEWIESKIPA